MHLAADALIPNCIYEFYKLEARQVYCLGGFVGTYSLCIVWFLFSVVTLSKIMVTSKIRLIANYR